MQVAEEEAQGPWQRGLAYKGFGPSVMSLNGELIGGGGISCLMPRHLTSRYTMRSIVTVLSSGDVIIAGGRV